MRKRLKKLFEEAVGVLAALGAASGTFWGIWFLWGNYIKELFRATLHITAHSVVWGGAVLLAIATVVRLAEQRYPWLKHSMYYVLSHWFRGKLQRGVQELNETLSGRDRKRSFLSMYIYNMSDHWLAQKVEEWGTRILYVLFWPVAIVAATHSFQDDVTTAGGYALTISVMVLVWAVVGAKLRNMALLAGISGWLAYIVLSQGGLEAEAQAAVIGGCFVLWAGWREWKRRITHPVAPVHDDDPQPDEDDEDGDGSGSKPAT